MEIIVFLIVICFVAIGIGMMLDTIVEGQEARLDPDPDYIPFDPSQAAKLGAGDGNSDLVVPFYGDLAEERRRRERVIARRADDDDDDEFIDDEEQFIEEEVERLDAAIGNDIAAAIEDTLASPEEREALRAGASVGVHHPTLWSAPEPEVDEKPYDWHAPDPAPSRSYDSSSNYSDSLSSSYDSGGGSSYDSGGSFGGGGGFDD